MYVCVYVCVCLCVCVCVCMCVCVFYRSSYNSKRTLQEARRKKHEADSIKVGGRVRGQGSGLQPQQ